jgi:hypothetical protein
MLQRKSSVAVPPRRADAARARRVAVMVLLAGLAACGQKGPLTLTKPMPAAPAASSPR